MSAIIKLVAPAELLLQPGDDKKSIVASRKIGVVEPMSICEPEQGFWKLSAPATWPKFAMIEVFVLVVFLRLALVGIISCFAELSHLFQSDAVGRVAARAISGRV
jgi:hypothetical protein